MNEYNKQATDFLSKTGILLGTEFVRHGKHFADDKESRDIYEITLMSSEGMPYSFEFGQSINNSGKYKLNVSKVYVGNMLREKFGVKIDGCIDGQFKQDIDKWLKLGRSSTGLNPRDKENAIIENEDNGAPTAYDVLTCLTKCEPEPLPDFLSEFGYNDTSESLKQGMRVYPKVMQEWNMVKTLWTEEQIEELQEIQ